MATARPEILVPVCGFDMQVSLDPATFKVDPCVEEGYLLGRPGSSKFDGRVVTVKTLNKSL